MPSSTPDQVRRFTYASRWGDYLSLAGSLYALMLLEGVAVIAVLFLGGVSAA